MQAFPELAAKLQAESSEESIEGAKKLIKDWLDECSWLAQVRELISESGQVGAGVMKGPFPKRREVSREMAELLAQIPMVFADPAEADLVKTQLESRLLYSPTFECIKVENCYPSAACGRDIQNGRYFFERIPDVSRRRLMEMADDPTYMADQIQACLKEGPKDLQGKQLDAKERGFDLWVRSGLVDMSDYLEELEALEEAGGAEQELSEIFLSVVLCNHRVIKLGPPMLEKKQFPYRVLPWEPREDSWAGVGIPEQIETPQRGLNAAVRSLMDNMGYSVGPQVIELGDVLRPKDGDDSQMRPYKHWVVDIEALRTLMLGGQEIDPAKAMVFLEFPNYLNKIMPVIQYWLKMAEDTTGLPLLLQGQATTDAVGVSQQLMNNSTTNLRLIVKSWDDCVCRPNIEDAYEWAQLYGPDSVKGDAKAISLGSSTLLVKELQMQAMLQIGDRVVQPIYGLSPKKWMRAFLEGFQIDADHLALDPDEQQQLEAAANQPDPRVEAANIQGQVQMQIAQLKDATDRLRLAIEAQSKAASIQQASEAVQTQGEANVAQELIKQQGEHERKGAEIAAEPAAPAAGAKGNGETPPEPEMDVDAALNTLGLQ